MQDRIGCKSGCESFSDLFLFHLGRRVRSQSFRLANKFNFINGMLHENFIIDFCPRWGSSSESKEITERWAIEKMLCRGVSKFPLLQHFGAHASRWSSKRTVLWKARSHRRVTGGLGAMCMPASPDPSRISSHPFGRSLNVPRWTFPGISKRG
jgi:hypothetical protein